MLYVYLLINLYERKRIFIQHIYVCIYIQIRYPFDKKWKNCLFKRRKMEMKMRNEKIVDFKISLYVFLIIICNILLCFYRDVKFMFFWLTFMRCFGQCIVVVLNSI